MSPEHRLRSRWIAAALCGALATGCSKSSHPTAPASPTTRPVVVTVEDTTGARVLDATVWAFGLDASTAVTHVAPQHVDAAGVVSLSLGDGPWSMFARN